MFGYVAFYRGRRMEVRALRSIDAREIAAKAFRARKQWEVTVVLAERQDGSAVVHTATD